jgi:signal transduction histidine kinase
MRRRLLISTLLVAVTAVLLLGVPLAIVMSRLVGNEASRELTHDTTLAQRAMTREAATPHPDYGAVAQSLPDDDYIVIQRADHQVARFGTPPSPYAVLKRSAKAGDYTLVVETSKPADEVLGPLALVAGLALVSVAVAVGLAFLQVRRFTRPLEELAESAARLGSGDAGPMGRRYGLPELDQVAAGLDGSARRVSDLLAAEREFASDASHQLRTPLTALSMRLEEMIAAADDPDAVRAEGEAALSQTERLTDVVSQLLGRTRSVAVTAPTLIGIDDILAQQVAEWDPAFRRANRKLEVAGEKGLRAYATAGTLAQVIATLLDNALAHGGGTVTIRTSQTAKSVVIEVRDEGHGVPEKLVPRIFERNFSSRPHGTGLGLALARTMATAEGGRVVLVRPRPAVFAVFLPLADPGSHRDRPVVSGPA